jgi:glycine cleavage system H protein
MNFPENLKYSKEHTWVKIQDEIGIVGISDFAQSQLGEIVYVDLPNVGDEFEQDETFGSIEALKTVSDLFMPISGEVLEINEDINDNPEEVNKEPYSNGWLIKIKPNNLDELNDLLSADSYSESTNED